MEGSNEKKSLGEFLQETRRSKGISLEEIEKETNISKKYLEFLEMNDYSVFPAETYVQGFLITYAEALEIDRDQVLSMYHRQMRIEQDSPIEQLVGIQKKSRGYGFNFNLKILGIVLGAIVFLVLIYFIIVNNISRKSTSPYIDFTSANTYVYAFSELSNIQESEYAVGDIIVITNQSRNIRIDLKYLNLTSKSLELTVNGMKYNLNKGEILNIDTDRDEIKDLGLELYNVLDNKLQISIFAMQLEGAKAPMSLSPNMQKYKYAVISEEDIITTKIKDKTSVRMVSEGEGFLEYIIDNNENRQVYLKNGTEIKLTFVDELVLMLGNAGVLKIYIGNKVVNGGSMGEVNKSIFYWKDNMGQYTLKRAFLK